MQSHEASDSKTKGNPAAAPAGSTTNDILIGEKLVAAGRSEEEIARDAARKCDDLCCNAAVWEAKIYKIIFAALREAKQPQVASAGGATPRTDAEACHLLFVGVRKHPNGEYVPIYFARTLERELAATAAKLREAEELVRTNYDAANAYMEISTKVRGENTKLQREVESAKSQLTLAREQGKEYAAQDIACLKADLVAARKECEQAKQYETWYAELLDVIYGERPDGENERPDPRLIIANLRARLPEALAERDALATRVTELETGNQLLKSNLFDEGKNFSNLTAEYERLGSQLAAAQQTIAGLREMMNNIAGAYANNEPISAKWAAEALAASEPKEGA